MGVDLRLLIVDGDGATDGYSHSSLDCHRNYDLWDKIKALGPFERPSFRLNSRYGPYDEKAGDQTYGHTIDDCYGETIKYLRAGDLAQAFEAQDDCGGWNKAIGVFLAALPKDMHVALYWH